MLTDAESYTVTLYLSNSNNVLMHIRNTYTDFVTNSQCVLSVSGNRIPTVQYSIGTAYRSLNASIECFYGLSSLDTRSALQTLQVLISTRWSRHDYSIGCWV